MTPGFEGILQPGDRAPEFRLSSVQTDGTVSLSDYRNSKGLFLGLFRGLYCPFCRRAIAQMATSAEKLKPLGIESLAVVATDLENARLYFRFRPMHLPLAVDPTLATHRSYRVPKPDLTPKLLEVISEIRINPNGELPAPMRLEEAAGMLDKLDGFQRTAVDQRDAEHFMQLEGQFLIDRDGVIRWANIECAQEGPAGMGKFPTVDELLAAAHSATSV
jgi:peroxiredoxin